MNNNFSNREIGNMGEKKAVDYIKNRGFTILCKNYFVKGKGEIDIIAQKKNLIVFFEIKKRSNLKFGGVLYSISNKKKSSLKKTASHYLFSNPQYNKKSNLFRFDLIGFEQKKIIWVEDIIR